MYGVPARFQSRGSKALSKYDPLRMHLARHRETELPMRFREIEDVLGFALPRSARRHQAWWANEVSGSHVQKASWRKAGRRTARLDLGAERVVFVQDHSHRPDADPGERGAPPTPPLDGVNLTPAAARLLADYTLEADGDAGVAIARAIHEAAVARRGRLVDRISAAAPRVSGDSTRLVREDRDGR
jgi:hypothetical protein